MTTSWQLSKDKRKGCGRTTASTATSKRTAKHNGQDKKRTRARTWESQRAACRSSWFKRLTRKTHLIWSAFENTIETAPRMTNDTPWLYTPRSRKLTSRVSPRLEVSQHRGTGATGDIMVLVRHALAGTHSRPYIGYTQFVWSIQGYFYGRFARACPCLTSRAASASERDTITLKYLL